MQYGPHMNELAKAIQADRAQELAQQRLAAHAGKRAGPRPGIRRRIGHGLIAAGKRLAYGGSQAATR